MNMHAVSLLLLAVMAGMLPTLATAGDAELRGRVTDFLTGASLVEAAVSVTPDGGGPAIATTTDVFGRYEFDAIPPGDYTLAASHPGYTPFSEARTYATDELASEDIALVPVDPGSSTIDLFIVVRDTSTMVPLPSVPVRVQRFSLAGPAVLEETIVKVTDADGNVKLRSQPKGRYTFRFNDAADGTPAVFYGSLDRPAKVTLEKPHTVIAQLLAVKQTVTVAVTGPDPAKPELGTAAPLANVWVELTPTTPDFAPPPGFDPMAQALTDVAIPTTAPLVGRTDDAGMVTFTGLPPTKIIVDGKKLGYGGPQTLMVPAGAGTLPATHPHVLDLAPITVLEVIVTSPYTTPDVMTGLFVKLEGLGGLEGTATTGIERIEPTMILPPEPGLPFGGARIEFMGILPGRYRVSIDQPITTPPVPALEDGMATIDIHFRGDDFVEVATGFNTHVLEAEVVPAVIRGRFFKADHRSEVPGTPNEVPSVQDRWKGPAYEAAEQPGIEFTQSALAAILPPGLEIVGASAGKDGVFTLTVLPGFYGVKIPGLTEYFGSNYRSVNTVTGEIFEFGWPYAVDPAASGGIPLHPFGSRGIPISSGDDLEIDLFVRKQLYFLDGAIVTDTAPMALTSPALDRVVARTGTGVDALTADFSHFAAPGLGKVKFDENDAAPPGEVEFPLEQGISITAGGSRIPDTTGTFLIKAPAGTHKVTLEHPHFALPSGIFELVHLPDYGFPGEGGSGDNIIPMENNWGQVDAAFGLTDPFTGDYKGDHSLLIRFIGKDPMGDPVVRSMRTMPNFFTHPGLGTRLFRGYAGFSMTDGPWTIWAKDGAHWYERTFSVGPTDPATITIDFKLEEEHPGAGGPTVVANAPTPTYSFTMRALNADNRAHALAGITTLMSDATVVSEPLPFMDGARTASYLPDEITGGTDSAKWKPVSCDASSPTFELDVNAQLETPTVETTLLFIRGSQVRGEVMAEMPDTDTTASITKPVEGARVTIRDRHGNFLRELLPTAADGKFDTRPAAIKRSEVLFVDIAVPGYERKLVRIASTPATPEDGADLDFDAGTITLKPLPAPLITNKPDIFDRRGVFLVGVRTGKDGGVTGNDPAVEMAWEVRADTAETHTYGLGNFDSSTGGLRPEAPLAVADPVRNIWIIDPRAFDGNPGDVDATPITLPAKFDAMGDPNPLFHIEMRDFLNEFGKFVVPAGGGDPEPEHPNAFLTFAPNRPFTIDGGRLKSTGAGTIDLASLPPGLFQPWIIVETRSGAVEYHQWKRTPTDPLFFELYGMKLPRWLASVADLLGTVKAAQEGAGDVKVALETSLPAGIFEFEPELEADIKVTGDKTLDYDYKLTTKFSLGEETPGTGILGMGSGFAGLRIRGVLEIGLDGAKLYYNAENEPVKVVAGAPVFRIGGGAGVGITIGDLADKDAYEPNLPGVKPRKPTVINPSLRLNASAKVKALSSLGVPYTAGQEITPLETQLSLTAGGGVGLRIEVDLLRALYRNLAAAPQFAAVLAAIRESELLKFTLAIEPRGGAAFERTLITRFRERAAVPGDVPAKYRDPNPNGERNFFLGEEFVPIVDEDKLEAMLLLGLETSLGMEIAGGSLGGSIKAETVGSKNPVLGFPALELEVNGFGDTPMIKRVRGAVDVSAELFLKAWIFRVGKEWTLATFPIDRPFNTEALFFLVEMDVSESTLTLAGAPAASWCGLEPHLVADHFPLARYAASGAALAFLDPDPGGGGMKLKVALDGGATWGAPVEVAGAPAIIGVGLHPLAGGGWMLVWSEIGPGALGDFAPATTIKYATSADGVSWTVPATLTAVPGTVFDFRLLAMPGGDLGLLWLESERGPGSTVVDLEGALFAAGAWSAPATLFDDVVVQGWDAAGPGFGGSEPAQVVAFTDIGGFVALGWDGTTVTPTVGLDTGALAQEHCALTSGPDDSFVAVYESPDGVIGMFSKTGAAPWMPVPAPPALPGIIADSSPGSLDLAAVDDGIATHYFVTWTTGADRTNIRFAYVDAAGVLLAGPAEVTTDSPGIYDGLVAVPVAGAHAAEIFSLFDNDGPVELRKFSTTEAGGLSSLDRDADLLDDFEELRIVDADPLDAITKIDDVLGTADFDGDGADNATEIAAGTDPIDADSFPGQAVEVTAWVPVARELGSISGQFYLTRTGDVSSSVTVLYAMSGTATEGLDYLALAGSATIPAGALSAPVDLTPFLDNDAEGPESATLTITPDAAYTIGASGSAIVTIEDTPLDGWRFGEFTAAELADPAVSGLTADIDRDALVTLLEYALGGKPKEYSREARVKPTVVEKVGTGERHFGIIYRRRIDNLDLLYGIERGSDLAGWALADAGEIEELTATPNGDGTETVVVCETTPISGAIKSFLRVRVTRVAAGISP
ncbi:MAG: hypothetical protein HKN82_03400 [Akkermansiaceae bacterium]|nr:hypothetical protein [Akkermansiaceae bacterium]NNM28531.1 hypothetical protein [Akkermansiaceae bacterium]